MIFECTGNEIRDAARPLHSLRPFLLLLLLLLQSNTASAAAAEEAAAGLMIAAFTSYVLSQASERRHSIQHDAAAMTDDGRVIVFSLSLNFPSTHDDGDVRRKDREEAKGWKQMLRMRGRTQLQA